MINLLPQELKQEYRYAQFNHRLVNWLAAFMVAIGGVGILTFMGAIMLNNSINSYQTRVAAIQADLSRENLTGVERQVTDISNNLKLMVTVLSKEILFSKLLSQLGSITPPDVVLTNLAIAQNQTGMSITAQAGSYSAAVQFQANLADPNNQIFSKADILNITCATGSGVTDPRYPCTVAIQAQFTQDNPFLFINSNPQKVVQHG